MSRIRSISVLAPTLTGGGMVRAYFLAEMIQSLNISVEIIGPLLKGQTIYPRAPESIRVHAVQCTNNRQYAGPLLKILQGDAIYAVKPKPASFGMGLYASKRLSRPLLLDIDDWERSYRSQRSVELIKLIVMEKLIRFADSVTVNNTALQNRFGGTLLSSGKNEKRYDPTQYDPDECRRKLGLENYFVIMFPGTAVPHSGLEDLLTAMDMFERNDLRLVIVGGRQAGKTYIERHLSHWDHCIVQLSEVSAERLPSVIAAAHIITAPHRDSETSRYNFPIKLIDGLAMGKPILATRVGDITETIKGAGYLAAANSPHDLAQSLQEVLIDPEEMMRRGKAARRRFEERFSLEVLGQQFLRIIDTL